MIILRTLLMLGVVALGTVAAALTGSALDLPKETAALLYLIGALTGALATLVMGWE